LATQGLAAWEEQPNDVQGKPDFFFRQSNVAVFVVGCFWHGCPQCGHVPKKNQPYWEAKIAGNRRRDTTTTLALEEQGTRVIRFWEHDVQQDPQKCITEVRDSL